MGNDSRMLMKALEIYRRNERSDRKERVLSGHESGAGRQETWILGLTTTNLLDMTLLLPRPVSLFVK